MNPTCYQFFTATIFGVEGLYYAHLCMRYSCSAIREQDLATAKNKAFKRLKLAGANAKKNVYISAAHDKVEIPGKTELD